MFVFECVSHVCGAEKWIPLTKGKPAKYLYLSSNPPEAKVTGV